MEARTPLRQLQPCMIEADGRGVFKTDAGSTDDSQPDASLPSESEGSCSSSQLLDATPQSSEAPLRNDEAPSSARRTTRRSWVIGPVTLANTDTTLGVLTDRATRRYDDDE